MRCSGHGIGRKNNGRIPLHLRLVALLNGNRVRLQFPPSRRSLALPVHLPWLAPTRRWSQFQSRESCTLLAWCPGRSLLDGQANRGARTDGANRTVGVVCSLMADENAGLGTPVVGDRHGTIRSNHSGIKIDQILATDIRIEASHPVCRVAGRAAKSAIDMQRVILPTGVLYDLIGQVVALAAERIRSHVTQVRVGV